MAVCKFNMSLVTSSFHRLRQFYIQVKNGYLGCISQLITIFENGEIGDLD